MVSLRVGTMQLHKLRKHALELEWSGGGRGRAEGEGLRGGKRWVEKGKGGCTMTSPPSYAATSQSSIASPCCWCHGMASLLPFLVFVCAPPHLCHLPTPS